jgi:hypothetical protein
MKREGLDPRTRVGALVVQPLDIGGRLVKLIGQCVVLLGLEKVYATMLTDQGRQGQFGYNPYAAMPSLHFAWALIVGVTLLRVGQRRLLRVAGLPYPIVMLVTILVSGNHLLLDAAGSLVVVTRATGATALARRGALIPWCSGNKPASRGVAAL